MHCSMTVYIGLESGLSRFFVYVCVLFCARLFFSVAIELFSMNKVDYKNITRPTTKILIVKIDNKTPGRCIAG